MENTSLFMSSYKILRHSKLAWLFGFIYGFFTALYFVLKVLTKLGIVLCSFEIIWFFMFIIIPLSLAITLYYEYLDRPLPLVDIWKVIRKYLIRWFGLFLLLYLPFLALSVILIMLTDKYNFMIVQLIASLFEFLFPHFLAGYALFTMLQNNLGFWEGIKQGAQVWTKRLDIKIGISFLYSAFHVIFEFFYVLLQNRSLASTLNLNSHDFTTFNTSILSNIFNGIYCWVFVPIGVAIVISIYFKDTFDVK